MELNINFFKVPKDVLWKLVIEGETEPCLRFFFPKMAAQIDFSKGVKFLGQELFKLSPEVKNSAKNRQVDKLIQVTMKTGEVRWLLIHIEVQGYVDKEFTKRMFEYFYRILEKYQIPVTALAIFTDDDPNFHPTEHKISCWGTEMTYRFNTYKVAEKTLEDFQDKGNIFSIIMETAWYNLKKNKPGDTALSDFKLKLIRRFFELGYSKERIQKILLFIGFYINFDDKSLIQNFAKKMNEVIYEKELTISDVIAEQLGDQFKEFYRKEMEQKVTEQLTREVTERTTQRNILKLKEYGFVPQQIAEMLEMPLEEVQRLLEMSKD